MRLLFLFLCLFAMRIVRNKSKIDLCSTNGSSSECLSLIQSRRNLSLEAAESVRSRIKSFVDSNRFLNSSQFSAFNMAMHCYSIKKQLSSNAGSCVTCQGCGNLPNDKDVCILFCEHFQIESSSAVQSQATVIPSEATESSLIKTILMICGVIFLVWLILGCFAGCFMGFMEDKKKTRERTESSDSTR